MKNLSIKNIILCALFAALIAVGAFIKIQMPFFDYITLQLPFVILAGLILGPTRGAISVLVYLLLGLAGLPVFAGGGGLAYIVKPTFGYLISFIFAAWVAGYIANKLKQHTYKNLLFASLLAVVVIYTIGITYKFVILNFYMSTPTSFAVLIASCFPLFIPKDIFVAFIVAYLAKRLMPIIKK